MSTDAYFTSIAVQGVLKGVSQVIKETIASIREHEDLFDFYINISLRGQFSALLYSLRRIHYYTINKRLHQLRTVKRKHKPSHISPSMDGILDVLKKFESQV